MDDDPLQTLLPEPRSEAERAYLVLRRELLNGEWLPQEKLRPQMLQERFRLGLTPIREALMRLAADGLVQGESQRGFRAGGASAEEWNDLMSTRRDLERVCLTRAIKLGDAGWQNKIATAMELLARTPLPKSPADREAAELWEVRHRHFHFSLVEACGSPWRLRFWNTLVDHSERYRKLRLLRHRDSAAKVRDAVGDHERIMRAVLAGDAERAATLMDRHLAITQRAVHELLRAAHKAPGISSKKKGA